MKQLFLTSSADCVLQDIVKHLPKTPKAYKLLFIGTAAESYQIEHTWVEADKKALLKLGFQLENYSITNRQAKEIEAKLEDKNGIFVCGGSTYYLMNQIITTGFDKVLKEKIKQGLIYISSSAGSIIMGQKIDLVPSIEDKTQFPNSISTGLAITDYAILPHWGSQDFAKEYKAEFKDMYCQGVKILPLTNQQYLYISGETEKLIQI